MTDDARLEPMDGADAAPPDESSSFGWAELAMLLLAILGMCIGFFAIESAVYEVLTYNAVPTGPRPTAPIVLIIAGLFGGFCWMLFGGLDGRAMARACWPLSIGLLFGGLIISWQSMGFLPLYVMGGLLLIVTVRLTRASQGGGPALSARAAWWLIGLAVVAFVLWTWYFQTIMYRRFLLGYDDVGWYLDRLHNTLTYGAFLQQNAELPRFWDHFCPGLALLLPFYWLWPSIHLLNLVQSLAFGSCALLLVGLALRRGLAPAVALGICLLYLLYPGVSQMTYGYSYGFHPPSLAAPFLILSFYLLDRGRYGWAILPAVLAMSMQEHIPIFLVGMGGAMLLQRRWVAGAITAGTAAAWFLFIFMVFMPWHVGEQNLHVGMLFGHLGASIPEIALAPILRPVAFWGALLSSNNLQLLIMLTLPLAGLWMLAPRFVIALAPVIVFNLLRLDDQAKSIAFHYQTGVVEILFLAVVVGYAQRREAPPEGRIPLAGRYLAAGIERFRRLRPGLLLAGGLVCSAYLGCYVSLYPWARQNIGMIPEQDRQEAYARAFQDLQNLIPLDATVTADDRVRASLYNRRLSIRTDGYLHYDTMYYVFLYGSWNKAAEETSNEVAELLATGDFQILYEKNMMVVLKRKTPLPPLDDHIF